MSTIQKLPPVPALKSSLLSPQVKGTFPVMQVIVVVALVDVALSLIIYKLSGPLITGIWVGVSAFTILLAAILFKKLTSQQVEAPKDLQVIQKFQPHFSLLNRAGFDVAVETTKAVVKSAIAVSQSKPHIFAIVDETLQFLLHRLVTVAHTQELVGEARDVRRQIERVQDKLNQNNSGQGEIELQELKMELHNLQERLTRLEKLKEAAVNLTSDLKKLRSELEGELLKQATGSEEEAKAKQLLQEKLTIEKRVQQELAGLISL